MPVFTLGPQTAKIATFVHLAATFVHSDLQQLRRKLRSRDTRAQGPNSSTKEVEPAFFRLLVLLFNH